MNDVFEKINLKLQEKKEELYNKYYSSLWYDIELLFRGIKNNISEELLETLFCRVIHQTEYTNDYREKIKHIESLIFVVQNYKQIEKGLE